MSLKERITEDMKASMRAKDAARLGAIRFLQAAIKQKEVDERVEVDVCSNRPAGRFSPSSWSLGYN